jgi:hypothetical protein
MATETRLVAVGGSLLMLLLVVELVRRRRLKEEYSVLWIVTALLLLLLSSWYDLLLSITHLVGAVLPTSTLFFAGLMFVIAMLLHFSVRVSQLERTVTTLVQELGIITVEDAPEPEPVAAADDWQQ